jgi:hypothetical protein
MTPDGGWDQEFRKSPKISRPFKLVRDETGDNDRLPNLNAALRYA